MRLTEFDRVLAAGLATAYVIVGVFAAVRALPLSPIRASQRARYPANWPSISLRIRERRSGGQCECTGICGTDHVAEAVERELGTEARCLALNGHLHPVTGSRVVLTVAHLDHTPENCDDANLLAMCQRCHFRYDADHHAETRAAAAAAVLAGQMSPLFDLPEGER